jgi:hypothetical protein
MAATITLAGDWLESLGSKRAVNFSVTGDNSYPTGGYAITAAQVGLGVVDFWEFQNNSGYIVEYIAATGKLKFYVDGGNLPSVVVTGGQGAGPGLQITPDTNAGVLGKTTATTRTIPGGTFGLVAGAGSLVEVAATTDLHLIVIQGRVTGR